MTKRYEAINWLLAHVQYQGDDCLIWPFSKDKRVGRGRCGYKGKMYWTHRLMCIFAHGEPPSPELDTAHSCGNGSLGCVNPKHLSWETRQKNCIDGVVHGTQYIPSGRRDKLGHRREELISRKGKQTVVSAAEEFGVSVSLVIYYWGGKERWPSHQR